MGLAQEQSPPSSLAPSLSFVRGPKRACWGNYRHPLTFIRVTGFVYGSAQDVGDMRFDKCLRLSVPKLTVRKA